MSYEGTDIQWIELKLDGPIDAEVICRDQDQGYVLYGLRD